MGIEAAGQIAANVVIAGASLSLLMKSIDWALSDAQKKRLDRINLLIWNRLDDARRSSLFEYFKSRVFRILVYVSTVLFQLWSVYLYIERYHDDLYEGDPEWLIPDLKVIVALIAAGGLLVFLIAKSIITVGYWLSHAQTMQSYLFRSFLILFASVFLFVIAFVVGFVSGEIDFSLRRDFDTGWVYLLDLFVWLGWVMFAALVAMLAVLALCLPLLIGICSVCLYTLEFVVRRLAEYPNGSVLGLSVLAGGTAALVKTFL